MVRICLCDDETVILDYITHTIQQWQKTSFEVCDITYYRSAEEMLFEHPDNYPFDLIILDIQMGEMNGLKLARKIREHDKKVVIAFLSGISNFVFEGYEVQAIRYLLKPLKAEQLFELLTYVKDILRTPNKYILLTFEGEKKKVNLNDILYIETLGHYLFIYTKEQTYKEKKAIRDIYEELDKDLFYFCHRSYIVNINHIVKIGRNNCTLTNNKEVPVSRNSYKALNNAFINYFKKEVFT